MPDAICRMLVTLFSTLVALLRPLETSSPPVVTTKTGEPPKPAALAVNCGRKLTPEANDRSRQGSLVIDFYAQIAFLVAQVRAVSSVNVNSSPSTGAQKNIASTPP